MPAKITDGLKAQSSRFQIPESKKHDGQRRPLHPGGKRILYQVINITPNCTPMLLKFE
jgi:hypothetical protein